MKTVKKIIASEKKNLGPKQFVMSPLPNQWVGQISPFIMLDHFGPQHIPAGEPFFVPPHPHRGFVPVTILFDGEVEHKDSVGNIGRIKGGDVQWMTAGSGVVHSEGAPESFSKTGGVLHLIQLWINLPAAHKMTVPSYQEIKSDSIPVLKEGNSQVRVIAGKYKDLQGPAKTFSPLSLLHISIPEGEEVTIEVEKGFNASYYLTKGETIIDEYEVPSQHLVWLSDEGTNITVKAIRDSELLFMAGEPINEPLVSYGPFVMNSKTEIIQAIHDYENGLMGSI
jgi:redox-sensitive bicupin YhaK (pirin superfamily)